MASIMRGTDIPFDLKNFPEGASIVRLDFAQDKNIVVTKFADDFTYDAETETYNAVITQAEALKFSDKKMIEVQLSFYINGHAKRTHIATATPDKILYEGVI